MQDQLLLSDFLEQVQDQIRGHFSETYSVVAEIASLSGAKHLYFELIEKNDGKIKAKCRANLWAFNRYRVVGHFQNVTRETLKPGMKVLLRVQAEFHVQYGFSLNIVDIDPSYSLGEFERIKQETIKQLEADGLIDVNKELDLPWVFSRLAVITSPTAAGYQDFMKQLEGNTYGYHFKCVLFECLVQGESAPKSIIDALNRAEMDKDGFDAIVLIRGGGSVIDLSCFDDYELNTIIAQSTYPVLTGIGHDRDFSVADRVAHTQLKTPTAAAEFIVEHNLNFEQDVLEAGAELASRVQQILDKNEFEIDNIVQRLKQQTQLKVHQKTLSLTNASSSIINNLQRLVNNKERAIDLQTSKIERSLSNTVNEQLLALNKIETTIALLNPQSIFEKGYTLTLHQGKPINAANVKVGDEIETHGKNLKLRSIVSKKG